MANVLRGLLKQTWQPQRISIRLKTNINLKIKATKHPHFARTKVEDLCKPKFPRKIDPSAPLYELCEGSVSQRNVIENPYEILLAKEALNWFKKHKFIFFFHQNSMTKEEHLDMQVMLKKCGVVVRKYGRNTLAHSFVGTMYESTLPIFHSHTLLGFGNNVNISSMLRGLKRTKITLLAGIIDNRFLSINELKYYSSLPNIDVLRASLVSTLGSVTGKMIQHINHNPQTLLLHLNQYIKSSKGN